MSLLDLMSKWIDKDRPHLSYVHIPTNHVDKPQPSESLKRGVHYIRLHLATAFLKDRWDPFWQLMVHFSAARFEFGNQTIEIPRIVGPTKPRIYETPLSGVIARNLILTPLIPFNGETVSITAGLFADRRYYLSEVKTLENLTSLLCVPELSSMLNFMEPLTAGIQEFLESHVDLHLGLRASFSEGESAPGYFAVIRNSPEPVNPDRLFVLGDQLYQGLIRKEARPFQSADYMLLRVELLDQRDDWEGLTSIQEPFQQALHTIHDQSQSTYYLRTALLRATLSPDLTAVDKRRVVDRLTEKYEQAKKGSNFKGAREAEIPTLAHVMRQPMSVKLAKGKGVPLVNEVFSSTRESSDTDDLLRRYDRQLIAAHLNLTTDLAETHLVPAKHEDFSFFYFATRGEGVRGNRVIFGGEFDLVFNHGFPSSLVLAMVTGTALKKLLELEEAELDISIFPRGLFLKEGRWVQRATFKKGVIDEEIVFHLKAADEPVAESGINVIFETKGAILYELFIPFELTNTLDPESEFSFKPFDFNLDELAANQDRQQRTARLHIFADGDKLSGTYDNSETGESFPFETKKLTRTALADLLGAIKQYLDPVPNHTIWNIIDGDLLAKPKGNNAESAFNECLEKVATAGWILYSGLAEDPEFAKVLNAIDEMKPGSMLSIRTNCAFLPWEILNSSAFNYKDPAQLKIVQPMQPQNFWGNRFAIECLLAGEKQNYKAPATVHKKSPAYVSMNIYRTIDNNSAGKDFQPGKSHDNLSAELAPEVKSEIQRTGGDIKTRIFHTPDYSPTMIYLLCHGQNDKPLDALQREKLEVDENDFIDPIDVFVKYKYPCGPIMFLNSCSSGASSPLAFQTFLTAFREKQALGLIATSFPVPITYGSAFGQEVMRRYLKNHQPIGQVLFDLRREQLTNGNPIGLFYSLQCPADITPHQ